jgi:hypothetical protein
MENIFDTILNQMMDETSFISSLQMNEEEQNSQEQQTLVFAIGV